MSLDYSRESAARSQSAKPPSAAFEESALRYRHDAAVYISALLSELRHIADQAELAKLVKALDAAYYEAYACVSQNSAGRNPAETEHAAVPHG